MVQTDNNNRLITGYITYLNYTIPAEVEDAIHSFRQVKMTSLEGVFSNLVVAKCPKH